MNEAERLGSRDPGTAAYVQRLEPGMAFVPGVDPTFSYGSLVRQAYSGRYFVLSPRIGYLVSLSAQRGSARTGRPVLVRRGYVWRELHPKIAEFRLWYEARRVAARALRRSRRPS